MDCDASDNSTEETGATKNTSENNLNMTLETIRAGANESCFMPEEMAQDYNLSRSGKIPDNLINLSLEFSPQSQPPTPKQPARQQTISKNSIMRGTGSG